MHAKRGNVYMKKSKILFFILGALVFSLSACNASNENSGGSNGPTSSHEHTYSSSWNYDDTYHWHDATCGHDVVSSKEIHTFNDVVTPASYSAGGYTTHTCTVCGYSYTDSQTDQLVHHYESGWSHDESTHWHACTDSGYEHLKSGESSHTFNDVVTPASYSAGGYTTHTCTVCGYSYTDSQTDRLTYSITWKNWDNSVLRVDKCYQGSTPSYGSTPTRNNDDEHYYVFTGWSPSIVAAYSDATYIAQYSEHERTSFTISYNSNGGNITPSSQTKTKGRALTLTSTKPTKEGHTFIGWNNIYENAVYSSGSSFNLDRDVTLWALWEDTCEHCNGTGTYSWTSTCSFCSGKGKRDQCNSCGSYSIKTVIINGIGGIKQCNNCSSTSISTKTCTWCNGKGSSSGSESCTYCNHTGHHGGDAPTISSTEARKISLNTVNGFEYRVNNGGWQSSPVFDNLKPSTSYTFYQRKATSGNVPFGETSKPLSASTGSTTLFYVTYQLNGGTNDSRNPTQYYSNQSNKILYNPTREHYTFANWTYNGTAVTQINASWAVDVELVANWNAYGYSITYNLDGGTNNSNNPTTHTIESGEIHLLTPTRKGYTFTGWTGSNGDTPELDVVIPAGNTSNLTYTAHWSLNTYTITYVLNGGTNNPSNPSSYTVLDSTITLANPTREHYDFKGWKNGNSSVTRIYTSNAQNYTLTATWAPHNYSITYNLDGGTNNPNNPTTHTVESNEITLGDPTRDGYTFIGWTGSNGDNPSTNVVIGAGNTDNLSYTANWSLNTYSITYHLDGGTNHIKNPASYTIEDTIDLRDASKDYYLFEGWFKEPEFINKVETLHGLFGDLDLYAKFTPFVYSASYNANGGALQFDHDIKITLSYGDSGLDEVYTIHQNDSFNPYNVMQTFRKESSESSSGFCSFDGWYLDEGFTNLISGSCVVNQNTTLYAKWIETPTASNKIPEVLRNGLVSSAQGAGTKTGPVYIEVPYNCTGSMTLSWSIWGSKSKVTTPSGSYYEYGGGSVSAKDLTTGTTLFSKSGSANSSSNYSQSGTVDISSLPGHIIQLSSSVNYGSSGINSSSLRVKSFIKNENLGFISLDNSTVDLNVDYDSLISSPQATRQGYDFAGWYDENDSLITDYWNYDSDKSFHAEWTIHNYNLNYVLNGGENSPSNPSTYNINDEIALSNPTREGYTFAGWYTDSSFKTRIETIHGTDFRDYTLYAKWTANTYIATLDYGGGQNCPTVNFYSQGNLIRTVDLYKGSTLSYFVPEAPSENLKFAGWYTNSSCTNLYSFNGVVNSNLNLYAKWIDVSGYNYSELGSDVNTQTNGNQYGYIAITSPINQTITITSSSGLDLFGAIYDENWNMIASCDDISDDNLDFSITVTLEAGKIYYIGYKGNQVSTVGDCVINITGVNSSDTIITGDYTQIIESVTVTYDSSFTLPIPKKDGYIFVGWFDENGNPIDTSSWSYVESITIYAHWIPAN